jgi:methyl-accepting chemotaxis protein
MPLPCKIVERDLDKAVSIHQQMLSLFAAQQGDAAIALFKEKVLPLGKSIRDQSELIAAQQSDRLASVSSRAQSVRNRSLILTTFFLAVAVFAASLAFLIVLRGTRRLAEVAMHMAADADHVFAAATQVCVASQSLAQGASKQASALEETSASS